jgi:hypothetical protein
VTFSNISAYFRYNYFAGILNKFISIITTDLLLAGFQLLGNANEHLVAGAFYIDNKKQSAV